MLPYNPSFKSNYTSQLADKVAQQAKQLQELQDYKVLCEKFILKLAPSQNLPVGPEDVRRVSKGCSSLASQISELKEQLKQRDQEQHFASRQILKLQDEALQWRKQFQKKQEPLRTYSQSLFALQGEKKALEETLRAEVLLNEEQRSCIEILKKALESRVKEFGLTEFLQRAAEAPGKKPVEFLVELVDAGKSEEGRRREIEQYRAVAAEEKARSEEYKNSLLILEEEYQDAKRKLGELASELENTHKELDELKGTNEKIEEEKNVLLDYVEELTENQRKLESTLESISTLNKKLAEEKLLCNKQIEELKTTVRSKVESYKQQLRECSEKCRELKANYNENKKNVENAIIILHEDHELLTMNQKTLEDSLNQIKREAMVKIERTKERLRNSMQRAQEVAENQVVTFRDENEELASVNSVLTKEKKMLQEDYLLLSESANKLQQELSNAKEHAAFVETKNKELSKQLDEALKKSEAQLEGDCSLRQSEYDSQEVCMLKKENELVKDELSKARSELNVSARQAELKQDQLKELLLECGQYRRELRDVKEASAREQLKNSARGQEESSATLTELRSRLLAAQELIQTQDAESQALKSEYLRKDNENSKVLEENKELKKQLREAQFTIGELKAEVHRTEERLKKEILYSEELITQAGELKMELNSAHLNSKNMIIQFDALKVNAEHESEQHKKEHLRLKEIKDYINNVLDAIKNFNLEIANNSILKELKLIEVKGISDFVTALKSITDFIKLSMKEMGSLVKANVLQKTEMQIMAQKMGETEARHRMLQTEQEELKERENYLKEEVSMLRQDCCPRILECSRLKEAASAPAYKPLRTLQVPSANSIPDAKDALKLEERMKRVMEENKELEAMLIKLCSYFPSEQIRETALGAVKSLLEVNSLNREKCEPAYELEKLEGSLKLKPEASVDPMTTFKLKREFEELKRIVIGYENRISKNRRQIVSFEDKLERLQQRCKTELLGRGLLLTASQAMHNNREDKYDSNKENTLGSYNKTYS